MGKLLKNALRKSLFNDFFKIDLTASERITAEESLSDKYAVGLSVSLLYGLVALPAILFLDVSLLVSVLIPITMVSGSAWFAVSLVNIKKKFENFGNDLTKDLYRSFCTSLVLLSLIAVVSLNDSILHPYISLGKDNPYVILLSGLLGTFVVVKMIYDVFSGATKYDMNDSMLTGQNESADRYYKKSLSLLNSCASNLRKGGTSHDVSAYYFSLAFYEVFNFVRVSKGDDANISELINSIEDLKLSPPANPDILRDKTLGYIRTFTTMITNTQESSVQKSLKNISNEVTAIERNSESFDLFNLRLSTVLEEVEDLLVAQGEALFIKRQEIEKKFLVYNVPNIKTLNGSRIMQGYTKISSDEEERVRAVDDQYFHTVKKVLPSGYREEIEKMISKDEFEALWPKTEGRRVFKTRYKLPLDKYVAELDIFEDANEGLVLVEVEFDSEEDANGFHAPEWFGEDVSGRKEYKNQSLAK